MGIAHLLEDLHLHAASLDSFANLFNIACQVQPLECYHLAVQSFLSYAFEDEFSTIHTNVNGAHHLLSSLKEAAPSCRFYFSGSGKVFGRSGHTPQKESATFQPRSVYGISKVAGVHLTRNYRESYGMYATCGILYNHESPRRLFEFVTRKITHNVAKINLGLANERKLDNPDARRDWGHAKDYVRTTRLMLQQDEPDDYAITTGETCSVRTFAQAAFAQVALDYRDHVARDMRFFRPES